MDEKVLGESFGVILFAPVFGAATLMAWPNRRDYSTAKKLICTLVCTMWPSQRPGILNYPVMPGESMENQRFEYKAAEQVGREHHQVAEVEDYRVIPYRDAAQPGRVGDESAILQNQGKQKKQGIALDEDEHAGK